MVIRVLEIALFPMTEHAVLLAKIIRNSAAKIDFYFFDQRKQLLPKVCIEQIQFSNLLKRDSRCVFPVLRFERQAVRFNQTEIRYVVLKFPRAAFIFEDQSKAF